jgi:hypothetical protein
LDTITSEYVCVGIGSSLYIQFARSYTRLLRLL